METENMLYGTIIFFIGLPGIIILFGLVGFRKTGEKIISNIICISFSLTRGKTFANKQILLPKPI
jgi:hypothetical protein